MERKKLISLFFFFFFSLAPIYSKELKLDSDKYILYNLNDNKVLLEEKAEEKTQIASLTKIMTVIVAIENIDDYNKKVTITNDMIKDIAWDVSVVGFNVDEKDKDFNFKTLGTASVFSLCHVPDCVMQDKP